MSLRVMLLFLATCLALAECGILDDVQEAWKSFKKSNQKKYSSQVEEKMRFTKFTANFKMIIEHNEKFAKGLTTYKMAINEFSDLSLEEFRETHCGFRMDAVGPPDSSQLFKASAHVKEEASVDWREKGAVTPVKNQGVKCGSCWAFSATGSLEGQQFVKTGKLISLSEQNLIDCSRPQGNSGCSGGIMNKAFKYVIKNKGINTEESYPYEGKNGKCRYKASNVGATATGITHIQKGNEDDLLQAVLLGPVSVAIDANHSSFQHMGTGVYYEPNCSSDNLDHGVLVVGYGTEEDEDYWIVKNSWGPKWGDKGYAKMSRNRDNNCGIATLASYPIV